jgi:hypothetical protein
VLLLAVLLQVLLLAVLLLAVKNVLYFHPFPRNGPGGCQTFRIGTIKSPRQCSVR